MLRLGGIPGHPRGLIIITTPTGWFCRHTQDRHYYTYRVWPKVKQVPMRKSFPTFEASSLVLDLDAEDNEGVRPFNPDIDGEVGDIHHPSLAKRKRNMAPMLARLSNFETKSKSQGRTFNKTKNQLFNPSRLTDFDLLSVALHGLPFSSKILNRNGIPSGVRKSVPKTLSYMRRRRDVLEIPPINPLDENDFLKSLGKCRTLSGVERLVSSLLLSTQPEVVKLVGDNSGAIANQCYQIHRDQSIDPVTMLGFMNDVSINLSSHGLAPSLAFEVIALDFAVMCRKVVAVQKYIKGHSVQSTDPSIGDRRLKVLRVAQEALDRMQLFGPHKMTPRVRRFLDIYSLLTGWNFGYPTPQPSTHIFYRANYRTLCLHVECLARLGAFRTMWYDWHDCLENASELAAAVQEMRSESVGIETGAKPELQPNESHHDNLKTQVLGMMASIYTQAILGPPHGMEAASRFLDYVDFTKATQDRREDCQLEMEAIIRQKWARRRPHRRFNDRDVGIREIESYEGVIADIFSNRNIPGALAGLKTLLTYVVKIQRTNKPSIISPRALRESPLKKTRHRRLVR